MHLSSVDQKLSHLGELRDVAASFRVPDPIICMDEMRINEMATERILSTFELVHVKNRHFSNHRESILSGLIKNK